MQQNQADFIRQFTSRSPYTWWIPLSIQHKTSITATHGSWAVTLRGYFCLNTN